MADLNLTQADADALIALEKHRESDIRHQFPKPGGSLNLMLHSPDKRESFVLDIRRGRIDLAKITMQNRGHQVIVLVRLDLGGQPHRNPDGEEISSPHLHIYREGFGDKWAFLVPKDHFSDPSNIWTTLGEFMTYCNITLPPTIDRGLFE